MTIKSVEGKTKCISDIITPSYADVQTLCKMVDKRDEIINDANAELLKRGCRISELVQINHDMGIGMENNIRHVRGENIELRREKHILDRGLTTTRYDYTEACHYINDLKDELKCMRLEKDKTDAENTRLWALDKNEMHRKYEVLHKHHLYEVASLNDTIDNMCKSVRELKTSCAEKDRHIEMLGRVEFEADDDGVHITYTVG